MKLASLVFVGLLGLSSSARADEVLQPPGGPVLVSDPQLEGQLQQPGMQGQRPGRQRGMKGRVLRRAMIEAFDANGDGRLNPRERMRALRVLRRMEMRLAQGKRGGGAAARRNAIRRYDLNHDGSVGPREMPPAAADRMRRMDRDRDGWVEPGE